ncbi:MAG TPA: amino acid permease, partial [Fimbriimonadaceae bacterium]|nr:amino acid permease [Fimbriimonadaceae bacterium]
LPLDQLRASELPIALALANIFGPLSIKIVAAAAIIIILTCNNAMFMVGSRILYGLGQEGLFPAAAKRVNSGGTPHVALLLTAVFALLLALTGKFELVFLIMGALGVLPLIVAEGALFKLRRSSPDLPRPYRAFAYPWLPALALLIDIVLLTLFIAADWKSGLSIVAAVAICIPIGWLMRNSGHSATQ